MSEQEIHAAADGLQQEGRKVTVQAVRERLGGGSNSHIAPSLRSWRARAGDAAAAREAPEGLRRAEDDTIRGAVRRLWALALEECEAQLESERERLREGRRELDVERAGLRGEAARLRSERDAAREGRRRAEADLATARERWDAREADLRERLREASDFKSHLQEALASAGEARAELLARLRSEQRRAELLEAQVRALQGARRKREKAAPAEDASPSLFPGGEEAS